MNYIYYNFNFIINNSINLIHMYKNQIFTNKHRIYNFV